MDIEKTIQFLVENAAQHDARIAAIESNMLTLTVVVKGLADRMAEHEQITREQDARSRQRDAELDARSREQDAKSRERDAALDERISKLVSAVAALVNGRSSQPPAQM
jgi:hypothetical protein